MPRFSSLHKHISPSKDFEGCSVIEEPHESTLLQYIYKAQKLQLRTLTTMTSHFDGWRIPIAADFHVHLRDGAMMEAVTPTIRKGGVDTVFVMVRYSTQSDKLNI